MAREEQYINEYRPQWEQLELTIIKMDQKNRCKLSAVELKEYLNLMKRVSHHLAYSRTHFPESALCQYLNELSVRAHNQLYVVKKSNFKDVTSYLKSGFALRIRENRAYIFAAFLIFIIGCAISYSLVVSNPQNAGLFLPESYTAQDNWDMQDSAWQEEQFFYLSSFVTTNNIGVAIKAFAFSITAGVLTSYVLFANGTMLGALTGLFALNSSNMLNYWALILPHGILELSAIFISGGAGLRVGLSLLIPGPYKRKDALIKQAKEAVMLMPGVIVMLTMAGLIEGFLTPARIPIFVKLGIAALTAVMLVLYVGLKRKNKAN